jgi:aerobic-type carbon monoxide dehydrogenase small subunit (CoxS/CutS family)
MTEAAHKQAIVLEVNGRRLEGRAEPRRLLSDFLRHDLKLTGTHVGCEQGACGSCTVLLDDEPVRSCLMLAVQCDGARITTIEGLAGQAGLHPLQQAFIDKHGLQCGFCTPGMLMAAKALLDRHTSPSEQDVREWLSGNLCRCTGYQFIIDAVLEAARRMREGTA